MQKRSPLNYSRTDPPDLSMAILEALDDFGKEYFDAENSPISHSAERRISNLRILVGAIPCGPGTFSARSQVYPGLRPGGHAQPRRGFGSSDIELGTLSPELCTNCGGTTAARRFRIGAFAEHSAQQFTAVKTARQQNLSCK